MDIVYRIRGARDLTPTEQHLANTVLAMGERVQDFTIKELASATSTSIASIHRLCRKLGLEGYKELKVENGVVVDEEMEETDYLIGFELDVDKLVYAEILVNWPMKVLCKEDCKGICKVCGMNLNKGTCDCRRTELDPRMAAIQDIFSKFKEV